MQWHPSPMTQPPQACAGFMWCHSLAVPLPWQREFLRAVLSPTPLSQPHLDEEMSGPISVMYIARETLGTHVWLKYMNCVRLWSVVLAISSPLCRSAGCFMGWPSQAAGSPVPPHLLSHGCQSHCPRWHLIQRQADEMEVNHYMTAEIEGAVIVAGCEAGTDVRQIDKRSNGVRSYSLY